MNKADGKLRIALLRLICVALGLFCHSHGLADQTQPTQYNIHAWDNDDGLPQNSVQAILQTRDGYLWVGTQQGLARFDGIKFTVFDTNTVPELKGRAISTLLETHDGSLWIGTFDGGVTRLQDGKFSHYGPEEGLCTNFVKSIYETSDGRLWIGTLAGLQIFKDGKLSFFGTPKQFSGESTVRAMAEDHNGNLWLGTTAGLQCYHDGHYVTNYTTTNGLPSNLLRALWVDQNNDLWIGATVGLSRLHNGVFTHFQKKQGLTDNNVDVVYSDSRSNLWIGTYGGLGRFVNGRIVNEFGREGAAYDVVNTIFEDREGNLWVGAKDGLYRLTPKRFTSYTTQQGLSHNNIISVLEDKAGTLWISTWGGGLNQMKGGKFSTITKPGQTIELGLGLFEDSKSNLWYGTDFDGGLYRLKDGKIDRFGRKQGLNEVALRVIYEARDNTIWLGTSSGLTSYKNGKFRHYTKRNGYTGHIVHDFCEDLEGDLWIASDSGIFKNHDGKLQHFGVREGISNLDVMVLYADREGNIWMGTRSGGLLRFRNGKFITYGTNRGLYNEDVFAIVEDDNGCLWMTCRRGVFRVRKSDLDALDRGEMNHISCVSFGKSDGLISTECNSIAKPSAWKTRDGKLWFPTAKGLAVTDSKDFNSGNEIAPPIKIESIFADKTQILSPISTLGHDSSPITIQPGRGELEFHYTALSFRAADRNRFKYMLDGVDADWVDADNRRVAYYNNIYPGKYTFRVIGCNNDGVWNTDGAKIDFVIQPHFYQSWWFIIAAGFATLLVIAGTARVVTSRKLQYKLERLQQQHAVEKERTRIAKDMHDEIGAKLTKISFLSEVAKRHLENPNEARQQIDTISSSAREVLTSLDEIVWAVNPKNDTLENLATFVCRYASAFFESTPILCQFDIPSSLPHWFVSTDVRHNLFLAIKEALNNALKYSCAKEVLIRMALKGNTFEITVSDDGCGFSVPPVNTTPPPTEIAATQRVGNGLSNMRQRLEQVGGRCVVQSQPSKGTTVHFTIPLPPPPESL